MTSPQELAPDPLLHAIEIGNCLVAPKQTVGDALSLVSFHLGMLGCPSKIHTSETDIIPGYPDLLLVSGSESFDELLGLVTRHTACRSKNLPPLNAIEDSAPLGSRAIWYDAHGVPLPNRRKLNGRIEGVHYTDPDAELERSSEVAYNAGLLRTVLDTLAAKGYPLARAEDIARTEFEHMFSAITSRQTPSMRVGYEVTMLHRIMQESGLNKALVPRLKSIGRGVMRFVFSKSQNKGGYTGLISNDRSWDAINSRLQIAP